MKKLKLISFFYIVLFIAACSSNDFKKSPVDNLIKEMSTQPKYTILLHDMDVEGTFSKTYKHQYQIITEKDSTPSAETTDWYEVSENFFMLHQNNMGMEIASKAADGTVTKTVSPPGYSQYVGNSQYGQWKTGNDGSSFWEFYGKYAMLSTMFNLISPVQRSYWSDYRSNYYGMGRPYYGQKVNGAYSYGTYGRNNSTSATSNTKRWNTKASNSNFKNRVNSSVSRSSRTGSSSTSSRTGSRYFSGSSSRSRGGGSGK